MKKLGGNAKSADIRSYFKALSSSQQQSGASAKPKEDNPGSSKRKVKPIVESDEEDFAATSPQEEKQVNGAKTAKSSPKKGEKEVSSSAPSNPKKSKKDESKEKGDSSKSAVRKTESKEVKSRSSSESRPSSSKSSPVKTEKQAEDPPKKEGNPRSKSAAEKSSKESESTPSKVERKDARVSPRKGAKIDDEESQKKVQKSKSKESPARSGKPSKGVTLDRVKSELKELPSPGGKKRSAKVMQESDEDDSFNPMPPPSKKKTKGTRHEVTVTPKEKVVSPGPSQTGTPKATGTPDEKKRQSAASYFKYLSRPPPKHLGEKEVPEGAPDCLANFTFVLTGVLPSFERNDMAEAIKKYGGRVTSSVSKKTSYVLVGDEPGASKIQKAKVLGVPVITEDDVLDMIRKSNPNAASAAADYMETEEMEIGEEPTAADASLFEKSSVEESTSAKQRQTTPKKKPEESHEFDSDLETPPKVRARRSKGESEACTPRRDTPSKSKGFEPEARKSLRFADKSPTKAKAEEPSSAGSSKTRSPAKVQTAPPPAAKPAPPAAKPPPAASAKPTLPPEPTVLWVDKYRPTTLKQIVGQTGDASCAKKLFRWLQNWFNYHGSADDKAKASWPGLRDPDGKTFKAALLSGPPGVGKTTTAHLTCKELGLDYIELNASDQRNKNGLKLGFSDSLSNLSISAAARGGKSGNGQGRKHVLIMDEVDGMSGNEDRGGIQELIGLIKTSRVPIICICNDRQHPKIRSLANYCFDLRFTKPRFEQLKAFVMSICFKEKLKVPPEMLIQLIKSTDQDIRQILHQLQLFKEAKEKSSYDPRKDIHLGPWEVVRKVFSAEDHKEMSINDKQSLFFHDYSLGPLFVYENYLRSVPRAANGDPFKTLDLVRAAAESISIGDRVEKIIRSNNSWSLLPVQAIFSSVFPGEYMEGTGMLGIEFPQWLGKNSNRNKRARLLQELHTHMHLQISGSLEALNMDYLPYLRRSIVNPLANGDAETAAQKMHDYCLLREDLESLTELAVWPNMKDLFERVDTKTKTAFTRMVNKEAFVPYSVVKISKGKGKGAAPEDELEGEGEGEVMEEEEEEDIEKDAMIKMKKPKGKAGGAKAATSKSTAKKSKGKRAASSDIEIDSDSDEDIKPKGKGKKGGGGPSKSRKK